MVPAYIYWLWFYSIRVYIQCIKHNTMRHSIVCFEQRCLSTRSNTLNCHRITIIIIDLQWIVSPDNTAHRYQTNEWLETIFRSQNIDTELRAHKFSYRAAGNINPCTRSAFTLCFAAMARKCVVFATTRAAFLRRVSIKSDLVLYCLHDSFQSEIDPVWHMAGVMGIGQTCSVP